MAYTALARKWRPKKFAELVGQEHVRRALVNALESGRVHHAFLFTGTRGVGKTTIARIFAKCLNCESGVTAEPCGECAACREIDSGRFVDLIEVDAASRTKVDDTRELLDNVQYSPTRGRYKVYLVDEVHMLSTHSFNALLKTLEEPPPHVKFLLATTDPQKLPVTVLSRCLQFNLKRLPVTQIAERMRQILDTEGIAYEPAGLRLVAQAADGSVRDGLSLLDQLIAFGGGKAGEEEARAMLGTISRDHIVRLAGLLAEPNVPELMRCAQSLEEFAPDYAQLLDELASLLVRVAMRQAVPDYEGDDLYAPELLERLAKQVSPEDVQLFYQTAIVGRRDLALAPDPRTGFEMTLVRMIAFRPTPETARAPEVPMPPGPAPATSARSGASASGSSAARAAALAGAAARSGVAATSQAVSDRSGPARGTTADPVSVTARSLIGDSGQSQPQERRKSAAAGAHLAASGTNSGPRVPAGQTAGERPRVAGGGATAVEPEAAPDPHSGGSASGVFPGPSAAWTAILGQLELSGMAKQLAGHCLLIGKQGGVLRLALDPRSRSLDTPALKDKLAQALSKHFGEPVVLEIETAVAGAPTPAASEQRSSQEELESARRAFEADPGVQGLRERFGATLLADTVRPVKS